MNLASYCRELAGSPLGRSWSARAEAIKAWEQAHPGLGALGVILLALIACSVVVQLLSAFVESGSLAMVYMAGATAVAIHNGLRSAVVFVLLSVVSYDLVFLKPYWTLTKLEAHHYLTFGLMLGVGGLISSLASTLRQRTLEISEKARRTRARNELANDLAQAASPAAVQRAVSNAVQSVLGRQSRLDLCPRLHELQPPAERQAAEPRPVVEELRIPLTGVAEHMGGLIVEGGAALSQSSADLTLLRAFADQAAIALERLYLENGNSRARVEAETERLRSTLLAAISHDFRTPITTIVGSVSTLLEQGGEITPDQRDALLRNVLGEARRVHHLMSNLLDLTRIEGGAVQARFEWCPVDELVAAVLAPLEVALGDFRLSTRFDPEDLLWCDPRLLEQLLGNLMINAVHHAPRGSAIEFSIAIEAGEAQLTVGDDGPGFPAGREQDMVKKFSRGDTASGRGTGLGLAICAAIARMHSGNLEVANRGGAWVQLSMPQPAQPAQPVAAEMAA